MKSDRDYAHEVGHLMGLGDDYNDHGSVAGRAGTLMDGGDAIDQNLVNRIGNIIKKAGIKLPSCWTGTIESDTSRVYLEGIYGGHTHCTDRWRGTLEFGIAADGKIEGNGEAHLLSKPTCYAGVGKVATLETFVVRGRATDKELTLELAFDTGNGVSYAGWSANDAPYNGSSHPELVGPPLSVPRTDPCTAAGTVTVHDKLPSGGTLNKGAQNTQWWDFAPRLGMVWDPKGNGRMAVRAACGKFYDIPNIFWNNNISFEPPFGYSVSTTNVNFANPWASFPGGHIVSVFRRTTRQPRTLTWRAITGERPTAIAIMSTGGTS